MFKLLGDLWKALWDLVAIGEDIGEEGGAAASGRSAPTTPEGLPLGDSPKGGSDGLGDYDKDTGAI